MRIINKLSIGKRLVVLVSIAFTVVIVTALTGMVNNQKLATEIDLGYKAITRPLAAVGNAHGEFNAMRTALYDLAHDFNTTEQNVMFKEQVMYNLSNYERNIVLYKEILDRYGTNDPYEEEAVTYLHEQLAPLRQYVEHIVSIAEKTGYEADAVRILRGDFLSTAEDISFDLMSLTEILEAQTNAENLKANEIYNNSKTIYMITALLSAFIMISTAYLIVVSITKPLAEMTFAAGELSEGKLDIHLKYRSKNELGILAESLRLLAQSTRDKQAAENNARESEIAKERADAAKQAVLSGIEYASKIQRNILPLDNAMEKAFSDYSVIWKPRDVVGGDIYWMKQFETGLVLVVADCTGHGTSGALLSMLVVSTLEAVVLPNNCCDTAEIIWRLEQRLVDVFSINSDGYKVSEDDIQDGCDLAVLFIANDGNITLSAGHTNVYVCDGKEVNRIKGQKLNVGEGKIQSKDEIKTVQILSNPDNKFYIASDGLSDQLSQEKDMPFGYRKLGKIVLANHDKSLSEITDIVWSAFEEHRGDALRLDDFELVAFKPCNKIVG